jgi:hypothetical protein
MGSGSEWQWQWPYKRSLCAKAKAGQKQMSHLGLNNLDFSACKKISPEIPPSEAYFAIFGIFEGHQGTPGTPNQYLSVFMCRASWYFSDYTKI